MDIWWKYPLAEKTETYTMIKFFRHIRKSLLQQNKTGKYFKYAIGEIVLVVIGILIALSINNWNENKKANTNFKKSLVNVFKDLEVDLNKAQDVISNYNRMNTISNNIIEGNYSAADYRKNMSLPRIIFNTYRFHITDMGYKALMQNTEIIPSEHEQLIAELNQQYIITKEIVEDRYNGLYNFLNSTRERYALNYPWFSQRDSMNIEKSIQHYANNPIFKNEVRVYQIFAVANFSKAIQDFYSQGLFLYLDLKTILKDKSPQPSFFPKNAEGYDTIKNDYLGNYLNEIGIKLIIKKKNDFLYIYRDDVSTVSLLTMISKDTFYNHRNGFTLSFKRDESNKVIGWSNKFSTINRVKGND